MTEREFWLSVTQSPSWKQECIADPTISLNNTIAAIVSAFPERKQLKILEIGCGYGRLTREIRQQFHTAKIFGLDLNNEILKEAAAYDPDTTFMCGDTITGRGYHAIYSAVVFQHLPDIEKHAYIMQAYKALTKGGVLRVQWVPGDRAAFCDHLTPAERMIEWCETAGFKTTVEHGLVHPQWSWLTGVK
jgi:trans-aconitate methyltransferase